MNCLADGIAAPASLWRTAARHADGDRLWLHRRTLTRILATGAARSGRRTPRPHARPAAPLPWVHEGSRHEAAMPSTDDAGEANAYGVTLAEAWRLWGPADLLAELQRVGGPGLFVIGQQQSPRDQAVRRLHDQLQEWLQGAVGAGRWRLSFIGGAGAAAPRIDVPRDWAAELELGAYDHTTLHRSGAELRHVRVRGGVDRSPAESVAEARKADLAGPAADIARPKRKASISYQDEDAPLVAEMHAMVHPADGSEGIRPFTAAMEVVARASGGGTPRSKGTRLLRAYKLLYPGDFH